MAQNCNVDLTTCSVMTIKPTVFYSILIVCQHAFINSALTQLIVIVSRLQQRSRLEISYHYQHRPHHCYQYYYLLEAMYILSGVSALEHTHQSLVPRPPLLGAALIYRAKTQTPSAGVTGWCRKKRYGSAVAVAGRSDNNAAVFFTLSNGQ